MSPETERGAQNVLAVPNANSPLGAPIVMLFLLLLLGFVHFDGLD